MVLAPCIAQDSLNDVLDAHANLSSFKSLLQDQLPQLSQALGSFDAETNPVTILAPSNHAFDGLTYIPELSGPFANNDTAYMSQVIAYHSLMGSWTTKTLNTTFKFLPSMTNGTSSNGTAFSAVTGGQRVGAVLQPGGNTSSYEYEIVFTSGAGTRSVVDVQDIAFSGGSVATFSPMRRVGTDFHSIVQIIDSFLVPPDKFVPTAESYDLANLPYEMTAFLGAVYSLPGNTLSRALNTTKDLTIFAPVNVAFEMVAATLLNNSTTSAADLMDTLQYHVVAGGNGPVYSSDFSNGTTLQAINDKALDISFYPNSYFVNSARIITSDILIYNGVIHLIDVVLSPDASAQAPNPTLATQKPVLAPMTGSVNISQAPFTTYLPNYIPTETPTDVASPTYGDGFTSSAYQTASSTSTKKSDASAVIQKTSAGLTLAVWLTIAATSALWALGLP